MNENMEDEVKPGDVRDDVLAAIRRGEAKMQPKWRFTVRMALTIIALSILFFILVYIASFVVFMLHESGIWWFVPVFGLQGWYGLFAAMPWLLITFSGIFIILLALLVRKYPFSYRYPLAYSILGILFLIAAGTVLIVQTSLEKELFYGGPNTEMPFIGGFYSGFGIPDFGNAHHGTIITGTPYGFLMEDLRDRTITVIIMSSTVLRGGSTLVPGDAVVVFGNFVSSGTVEAVGVEELSE